MGNHIFDNLKTSKCSPPSTSTSFPTLPHTTFPTPPSRNSMPARQSSPPRTPKSTRSTLTLPTLSPLDTTNSPPGPQTRCRDSMVSRHGLDKLSMLRTTPHSPTKLTGSPRVPLPQSRTRDLADHAGPSHPLDAWKVLGSSRPELSSPSPSRSLSTVTTTDPRDAMVAPWRVPSTGMRPTNPNWSPSTPTLPRTEPAKNPHTLDSSTALATRPSPLTPHLHF